METYRPELEPQYKPVDPNLCLERIIRKLVPTGLYCCSIHQKTEEHNSMKQMEFMEQQNTLICYLEHHLPHGKDGKQLL